MQSPQAGILKPRILVTGFLGFKGFEVNPSSLLARSSGRDFALIEVSYRAVEDFLQSLNPNRFDHLLLLGVDGRSSQLCFERIARNVISPRLDVRGEATAGKIDPAGPDQMPGRLWTSPLFQQEELRRRPSDDAGEYLCNFIYYRALQRFQNAGKRIGFLHVPPQSRMPLEVQQLELAKILDEIT